jgi:alcohol dehydrogenase class IV
MPTVVLQQPPWISIGAGCLAACPDWLALRGLNRAFFIASPETAPLAAPLRDALGSRYAGAFHRITGEPSIVMFEEALAAARAARPDAIIGIGGGSALDAAKLVAALLDSTQTARQVFGIGLLTSRRTALVCVPTTAGTGSEVSPNSILIDEDEKLKKGVISPFLVPDAAFVDPCLTLSLPPLVTAFTGMDALTHCIEAYTNKFSQPAVDLYALAGIRLIAGSLEQAFRDGNHIEARENMARGSLYGGLCLGPVNTAAVHALAYPLGGEFHVPHGLSNALLLPHVMEFNLEALPERYADVALALGAQPAATPVETARRGVSIVRDLCRAVGMDRGLGSVGVPESAIEHLADAALTVQRLLKNNPRPVDRESAIALYRKAYA